MASPEMASRVPAKVKYPCANPDCGNEASQVCGRCKLLAYCCRDCQVSHWSSHKVDCKSSIMKPSWRPSWLDRNEPPQMGVQSSLALIGKLHCLLNQIPAIDIANLAKNEGETWNKPLNLLFADARDLGNVVKTVCNLPKNYTGPLKLVINSREERSAIRNALLLMLCLKTNNWKKTADRMLHLWYSALVPKETVDTIQKHFYRSTTKLLNFSQDYDDDAYILSERKFNKSRHGTQNLQIQLKKPQWFAFLAHLNPPRGLTPECALEVRRESVELEGTPVAEERFLFTHSPSHPRRLARQKFQQDGLLLPFAARRSDSLVPNPTLFNHDHSWSMWSHTDPMNAHDLKDVINTSTVPASNDLYGKLYNHVRAQLRKFHRRIRAMNVEIEIFNKTPEDLAEKLKEKPTRFSRIDATCLIDEMELRIGAEATLQSFVPLLAPFDENPRARLIGLYHESLYDAIVEHSVRMEEDRFEDMTRYCAPWKANFRDMDEETEELIFSQAKALFHDAAAVFRIVSEEEQIHRVSQEAGAEVCRVHTVVKKFPATLTKARGEPGAQEEFERLMMANLSGLARYVEWRKRLGGA